MTTKRSDAQGTLSRYASSLKAAGLSDDLVQSRTKELAEKCGYDYAYPIAYEPYTPLGGATSFDAAEAYQEGLEWQAFYSDLSWKFQSIVSNILGNDDLTPADIAASVEQAATDFEARATAFRASEAGESPDDEAEEDGDIAAVEAGLMLKQLKRSKAGRRMQTGMLGQLRQAADTIAGVVKWGGYADNSEDQNEAQHEAEDAAAAGEGSGDTAGTDTTRMEKGQRSMRGFIRFMTKAKEAPKVAGQKASAAQTGAGFKAFKAADGSWRWVALFSNNAYDREGEVFEGASHKEFVAYVDRTKEYPALWDWHTPFKMGQADLVHYDEDAGMTFAAGAFFPGHEAEAKALADMPDLGVSHGYTYAEDDLKGDTYKRYRTFEISPLPREKAANEFTLFLPGLGKEDLMFPADKRLHLEAVHGKAAVDAMEAAMTMAGKAIDASGVGRKEMGALALKAMADGAVAEATPAAAAPATTNASAAEAAPGTSVPSASQAADASPEAAALAGLITDAVKAAVAPFAADIVQLKNDVKAMGMTAEERLVDTYFRPRAADAIERTAPSQSDTNLVSPRGGGGGQAAKDVGDHIDQALAEARKQHGLKEDGVAANVPEELSYYAKILPGAFQVAEESPL